MIEETIQSQAPNKVLMATPPPIDPAEQLLPRSYRSPLSQLRSGHCSRLMSYRHSVGWVDDPTCPDCCSTDQTVAHLFSCPTHPKDLTRGICGLHPSRSLNSWQGSHSLAISTSFPHNLHSRCWSSPPWPPAEPHHPHLTLHLYSFSPVVRGSSPPSAN